MHMIIRKAVGRGSSRDLDLDFQQPRDAFSSLAWKRGIEVPPLLPSNAAAVALFQTILDGTAVELPSIEVSEAVAVLVYRLVVSREHSRAAASTAST